MTLNDIRLAIIGIGYVGLPLAVEFGKKFKTLPQLDCRVQWWDSSMIMMSGVDILSSFLIKEKTDAT